MNITTIYKSLDTPRIFFTLSLGLLTGFFATASTATDFHTTLILGDPATSAGIDEVIFHWSTAETSGVVTETDLTDLSMELLSSGVLVYLDDIIVGGVVQPNSSVPARVLVDIRWEFDLDSNELLEWLNDVDLSGSVGVQYQVADPDSTPGVEFWAGNSHYYELVNAPNLSWTDARAAAEAAGGHLATITSLAENEFIYNTLGVGNRPLWLGGFQPPDFVEPPFDDGWQWVTGELFSYTNWAGGEPNNTTLDNEDSLVFWTAGTWNDSPTGWTGYGNGGYIIEYPDPDVFVRVYSGGVFLDREAQSALVTNISDSTAREVPTPVGEDIPVINIPVFEQIAAEVVVAGTTNADFCVAPDPRETEGKRKKSGRSKKSGKSDKSEKSNKSGKSNKSSKSDKSSKTGY